MGPTADSTCSVNQKVDKGLLVSTMWDSLQQLGPQALNNGLVCQGPQNILLWSCSLFNTDAFGS